MPPSTEGASATTRGTSTAAEAASTTTIGTAAAVEAAATATISTTATVGISASTGVTVTNPTAESSARGKAPPVSVVAPAAKTASPVETTKAMAPRPDANKDSAGEPARSVVAVGYASIGVIVIVAIRARRRWPHVNLCAVWIPVALPLARIPIPLIARIPIALIPTRINVVGIVVGIVIWIGSLGVCKCRHQQAHSK